MQVFFSIAAVVSVVALVIFLWTAQQRTTALTSALFPLLSLLLNSYGALKKAKENKSESVQTAAKKSEFALAASFKSGLFGGLIGGGAGGLLNGASYYLAARPNVTLTTWENVFGTFTLACVYGAVLGAFTQFVTQGVRHLWQVPLVSDVVGGILGGGLAGAILGFWSATLFGHRDTAPPNMGLVLWGGIFSAFSIVVGVLLYDHKVSGKTLKRALTILLPVTLAVATLGLYALMAGNFDKGYFEIPAGPLLIERGTKVGALVGALWGLLLGLTLGLYPIVFKNEHAAPAS